MYYPFLDGDSTDPQDLDNTATLPRYVDGKGLRAYIVAQGAGAGLGSYSMSYTNQDGAAHIDRQCGATDCVGVRDDVV